MNEVRTSSVTPRLVAGTASSTGAGENQPRVEGKNLPKQADLTAKTNEVDEAAKLDNAKLEKAEERPSEQEVESAVASMNDYVQTIQRDLHFAVDEDSDRTVVKVVDGDSGELIRQIPEEIFLELARKLNDSGELQLFNALG